MDLYVGMTPDPIPLTGVVTAYRDSLWPLRWNQFYNYTGLQWRLTFAISEAGDA